MKQIVLTVMGAIGLCMPMIGCLIGLIRYRKTKEKISAQLELERKQAEEKGGLSSLYYKREDKRLFKRTFGMPMVIGFGVGLILLCIVLNI